MPVRLPQGVYAYIALGMVLLAGAFTWLGMAMAAAPVNFSFSTTVDANQMLGLGMSMGIAVLWWARMVLVFNNEKLADS